MLKPAPVYTYKNRNYPSPMFPSTNQPSSPAIQPPIFRDGWKQKGSEPKKLYDPTNERKISPFSHGKETHLDINLFTIFRQL